MGHPCDQEKGSATLVLRLNKVTRKVVYPLFRIDDTFNWLRHACYFSYIDLKSGYWQIKVDKRDRVKAMLITPDDSRSLML